ncbi:MAG TPA: ComEC/Rec2 family competence protein, partial [Pilimelia sp.]|nr:ComEC/Rec2 family competence protein [Pilimelia sp.]
WVQRAAAALRTGLTAACAPLPDEPGGLLPGLAIGDTRTLPATVVADFRGTGMTHLVAVSGANVAIVLGAVLCVGRRCRAGPRLCAAACLVALAGFVILVRPSPSVLRAGLMGAIGLLALAGGRAAAAVPALAATVAGLVLLDPALAAHPGFVLSVSATAALVLIAPRWSAALRRRGAPRGLAEALAVPAAAQAACGPTVAAVAGTVNPVAVVANLLAAPAVAPATVLGVAAAVTAPVAPAAAAVAVWIGQWPAWWLVHVARVGAQVPGAALPWPAGWPGALLLAALTATVLLAGRRRAVRRLAAAVTAAAVLGAVPVRLAAGGWPPAGWLAVACDVGQGDAVVLPAGRGDAVVIDAGPEPVAVDRCLHGLGVRRVRAMLISHFHADHVGGVGGIARRRRLDAVVGPPPVDGAAGWRHVRAVLRRSPRVVGPGWTYRSGPVTITVLGAGTPLRGTRSDANNNSLVVSARVRGVSVLLTGDAEVEQQQELLAAHRGALRARVLKVAHHGSAYQDRAFLDAVRPEVALISAGAGNRYGHPHPAVLGALRRGGARTARTDVDGDVAVVVHGGKLGVAVRGPGPRPR